MMIFRLTAYADFGLKNGRANGYTGLFIKKLHSKKNIFKSYLDRA